MPEPDADLLTEPLPSRLWIELTSKCPFDCVFCSRRLRRGEGEHMDFALYRSLLGQLQFPEVICLNYSGESVHYPRLAEAIALARNTGAQTELVTALASIAPESLEGIVRAGLDRLTVSLHTLDERQFREIYGFGSLRDLQERLKELRATAPPPELDFAFVAMDRNLGQLEPLADCAQALGVRRILVCPVIRRDAIPDEFTAELDGQHRLTEDFKARLMAEVRRVRDRRPGFEITVANPEVERNGRPPEEARTRTCEQSPWSTAHVLANGDVVVCEVHDRTPLGYLTTETLRGIWWGEKYRDFRRRYQQGRIEECRQCPWRVTYLPGPLRGSIHGFEGCHPQLLAGWRPGPDPGVVWSKPESVARLARPDGARRLRVRGLLPPHATVEISANGRALGALANPDGALRPCDRAFRVPLAGRDTWEIRFRSGNPYCPAREGDGGDARRLGFALLELAAETPPRPWRRFLKPLVVLPPFVILAAADVVCRGVRRWLARSADEPRRFDPGISVVIPERDNPALLARCLASVEVAAGRLEESLQVIVVVNGTPPERYAPLVERHRNARWLWFQRPLGFTGAVRAGLRQAAFDWVYLLNNDMVLHPDALRLLLPLRAPDVFAIASQILPESTSGRREESNWTGWRFPEGVVEIYDAPPEEGHQALGSLYAGGGSSLFRHGLLEALAARAGEAYDPFYWEDVEWGVTARKRGWRVLFCPGSKAIHTRQATISKHYASDEIERIFRRNGYLFQLRNLTAAGSLAALARRVLSSDRRTILELLRPRAFLGTLAARIRSHFLPLDDRALSGARCTEDRCTIAP